METVMPPRTREKQLFPAVLDLIPFGIILLDESNQIIQLNQLAELVIAEADGLRVTQNALCASSPNGHQRLRPAVAKAAATRNQDADTEAEIITLLRSPRRAPLEILVTPLRRQLHTAFAQGSPSIAVLVWDPERTPPLRRERIRHMYQLTAAEATVTEGLARGMAVVELARELRVQTNTIRTHLKRIYDKTGARRQSELVRLLTRNLLLNMP